MSGTMDDDVSVCICVGLLKVRKGFQGLYKDNKLPEITNKIFITDKPLTQVWTRLSLIDVYTYG